MNNDTTGELIQKNIEIKEAKANKKAGICFVVTPIGEVNSQVRRHIEGVIDSVIEPVVKEKVYIVKVAHRVLTQGLITEDVINSICDYELVIANLTGLNPNVMFEVALRYCTDKPIIHICELGTNLPFDIKDQRTIFYTNDMYGVIELKGQLCKMIDSIHSFEKNKNIITATRKNKVLIDAIADVGEDNMSGMVIGELHKIKKLISENPKISDNKMQSYYTKREQFDLQYYGDDDFFKACEDFSEFMKKFTEIIDLDVKGEYKNLTIEFRCAPDAMILIKKNIDFYGFRNFEIPF
jgi:hypothetical protein